MGRTASGLYPPSRGGPHYPSGRGLAFEREVRAVVKRRMVGLQDLDPDARDDLEEDLVAGELPGRRVLVVIDGDCAGGRGIGVDRDGPACLKCAQERLRPGLGLARREEVALPT